MDWAIECCPCKANQKLGLASRDQRANREREWEVPRAEVAGNLLERASHCLVRNKDRSWRWSESEKGACGYCPGDVYFQLNIPSLQEREGKLTVRGERASGRRQLLV